MFRKSLLVLGLLAAAQANAAVIFSDDFEANSTGLNVVPSGWNVSNGNVDIIGVGSSWNYFPVYGRYIDLDGSSSQAGNLHRDFSLNAGVTYTVNFDLAGSQRSGYDNGNTVEVVFGSALQNYNLATFDPFGTHSISFTPSQAGNYQLSFHNMGGDNVGALLDNVNVSSVPLPAASWLFLTALMGGLGLRRKAS